MTTSGIPSFDKKTTFLVSHEGVVTAKLDPTAMEEVCGDPEKGNETALLKIARRLAANGFADRASTGKTGRTRVIKIPAKLAAIDAFTRIALVCVAELSASSQLMRTGRDREALHQMRIGLRRLRTAFTAFKGILRTSDLQTWKKETKWLAGELDGARDLDVFIEQISALKGNGSGEDPAWALFGSRLLMMRAAAYEQALAAIESQRFAAFTRDCADWAGAALEQPAADANATTARDGNSSTQARHALSRLHHRLRKAGRHLTRLDPADQHIARIRAKKLRYTAEFFAKTFDRSAERHRLNYIASLRVLQDALGDLNDLAMVQKCACAVAGHSAELAFHAGQIIGDRRTEHTRLLAKAAHAYGRWRDARPFWH
jgi:triphosphatase